jgi:hypothetical protein
MNPEQENFEALRKLLALKRHEVPPPRYFSELPRRIWTEIEREPVRLSIWERFFPNVGVSPAFAYSFGLLACGTLFLSVAYSLKTDGEPAIARPVAIENHELTFPRLATRDGVGMSLAPARNEMASTNPVFNAEPLRSLFNGMELRVEQAGYSPAQ